MRRIVLCLMATASPVFLGLTSLVAPLVGQGQWAPFTVCSGASAVLLGSVAWHLARDHKKASRRAA